MPDLVVTAANVQAGANARRETGIAGATITAGQAVYLDAATMRYLLADTNGTLAASTVIGVALNSASNGQPLIVDIEDDDYTPGATLTAGTVYVLSGTPGAIAPVGDVTTGWRPAVVFVAKSTTKANLRIVRSGVAV